MATRGAYNTRQRAQILQYLEQHQGTRLSVDELAQDLARAGTAVGKTTIYRLLESLCEMGAAKKYQGADGVSCYQYMADTSGCGRHAHLVCTGCGELMHLECELMDSLASHMQKEHGFALDASRTVLYGCCERCRKGGD